MKYGSLILKLAGVGGAALVADGLTTLLTRFYELGDIAAGLTVLVGAVHLYNRYKKRGQLDGQ